jgi:hypothetical protein
VVLSALKVAPRILLISTLVLVLMAVGCSSPRQSVSGKVTVDDKPLTTGGVTFVPDKEKGNSSTEQPSALISESGTYELYTDKKSGAPAGWYKVVVVAKEKVDSSKPKEAKSLIDEKYGSAETTDLSIEVKSGGKYDLSLRGFKGSSSTTPSTTPPMPK